VKLRCVSTYRSSHGAYDPGALLDVNDAQGAFLLRDAPGSFVQVEDTHEPVALPAEEVAAALEDVSAEMGTGLRAPDRRARGGRKR